MKIKLFSILIIFNLTSNLYSQDILADIFKNKFENIEYSGEEKDAILTACENIIRKYKITTEVKTNCGDILLNLDFEAIRQDLSKQLVNKMKGYKMNEFIYSTFSKFKFCSAIRYLIKEDNGLSIQENIERENLIEYFNLDSMSEKGKSIFFNNYYLVKDSIYKYEGVISEKCLRIDTIRNRSSNFFKDKLNEEDSNILDLFWQSRCKWFFDLCSERDSIHKYRVKNLKRSIDSLEMIYAPILKSEKRQLILNLDKSDNECLTEMNLKYIESFNKKRMYNWDRDALFYFKELPNYAEGLKYIYSLLTKYPSVKFAVSKWNYNIKCNIDDSIKSESYKYIEFEKKLSSIIEKHYPNFGMIYYSPYNRYNYQDIMISNDNMYMYYTKNK